MTTLSNHSSHRETTHHKTGSLSVLLLAVKISYKYFIKHHKTSCLQTYCTYIHTGQHCNLWGVSKVPSLHFPFINANNPDQLILKHKRMKPNLWDPKRLKRRVWSQAMGDLLVWHVRITSLGLFPLSLSKCTRQNRAQAAQDRLKPVSGL